MKKFLSIILSVLIIVGGFGAVVAFDKVKDEVNTTEVIVAKKDIAFKEKIQEEDLEVVGVPSDQVIESSLNPEDMKVALNAHAAIEIPKGAQIHSILLDSFDLIPNEKEGEFIAPIPKDWLFAVPQSLRKSYIADFYVISGDDQRVLNSLSDKETKKEDLEAAITNDKEPILKDVRISSVKDGSNNEVVTTTSKDAGSTGAISTIEIVANDEILNMLRDYTNKGYKLYVVYSFERSADKNQEDKKESESEDTANEG